MVIDLSHIGLLGIFSLASGFPSFLAITPRADWDIVTIYLIFYRNDLITMRNSYLSSQKRLDVNPRSIYIYIYKIISPF